MRTLLLSLSLIVASTAHAQVTFEALTLPSDAYPGMPSCPISSQESPAVGGGPIVYRVTSGSCFPNLVMDSNGVQTLPLPVPLPGVGISTTTDVDGAFGSPSIDGTNIAIRAIAGVGAGIWARVGGVWDRVAQVGLTIPDSGGQVFGGISITTVPLIDGGAVVFGGSSATGLGGIYRWESGVLAAIVDTTDTFPGGGLFSLFPGWALEGTRTYFTAQESGGSYGLFEHESSVTTKLVDTSTAIPGGTGTFSTFGLVAAGTGGVAVTGTGTSGQAGLYFWNGTSLELIADTGTASPGSGTLTGFPSFAIAQQYPSVDAGRVAFPASDGDGQGLFLWDGSTIERLASAGTPLLGETITAIQMKGDALHGNQLVFSALTGSGFRAYAATLGASVPALSSAARLALATLVLGLAAGTIGSRTLRQRAGGSQRRGRRGG